MMNQTSPQMRDFRRQEQNALLFGISNSENGASWHA